MSYVIMILQIGNPPLIQYYWEEWTYPTREYFLQFQIPSRENGKVGKTVQSEEDTSYVVLLW